MGWRELRAWLAAMNRDRERAAAPADPHSWAGAAHDPGWQALRAARDRLRGR